MIAALSSGSLRGDDALVLSAVAVRVQGAQGWSRFRAAAADLARTAGASPGALQVVNRLDGADLARREGFPEHGR